MYAKAIVIYGKMTNDKIKTQQAKNYKNFGLAVLIIVGIIIFFLVIGAIAHYGFLHGVADSAGVNSPAYKAGVAFGYSFGMMVIFYFQSGLFFGNLLALVASLEKRNVFYLVLLHGLLGWYYVVYYALTRKSLSINY
ncbi:hypothetical protein ZORO111902_14545 [Zobellia roscoffensis]